MIKTKDDLLTIRISKEDKDRIIKASKKQRVTMSSFVVDAAISKASSVIRKDHESTTA